MDIESRQVQSLARVVSVREGYEFSGLQIAGMRLVNEFQLRFPLLCAPSHEPAFRLIGRGSPAENLELEKLIAEVRRLDPDEPPSAKFSKRVYAARANS